MVEEKKKTPVLKNKKRKKEIVGKTLNPKQELFCRYYTQNDFFFGNATMSYAQAYGYKLDSLSTDAVYEEVDDGTGKMIEKKVDDSPHYKACKVCSVESNRLLGNPRINDRVNALLNEMMTDFQADAEIIRVMKQNTDYGAKLSAIREYNKLKSRVLNKVDLTTGGKEIPFINGMRVVKEKNDDTGTGV